MRSVRALHLTPYLLPSLRDWLSPADQPCHMDLIFVLAGGMNRKVYALELFRQQLAPKILFSVARFEIRRFSKMSLPIALNLLKLAQDVPPPERHYFVLFEEQRVSVSHVCPKRFGTFTEIASLAQWLRGNPQVRSLLIISNSTHLRRIRMCCQTLMGRNIEVKFVAAPPSAPSESQETPDTPLAASLIEFSKVLFYWLLLKLRKFPRNDEASAD